MKFNLNRADEMAKAKANLFLPIDLNEGNVQAIFNRCLETKEEKGKGKKDYAQILQKGLAQKDSALIAFDAQRRFENKKNISFLLGQLKGVHNKDNFIQLEYGILTYNNTKWTTSAENLFKLYELGMANGSMLPFILDDDGKTLIANISHIKPALSPKDPNFPAWWEAHKGEWEA